MCVCVCVCVCVCGCVCVGGGEGENWWGVWLLFVQIILFFVNLRQKHNFSAFLYTLFNFWSANNLCCLVRVFSSMIWSYAVMKYFLPLPASCSTVTLRYNWTSPIIVSSRKRTSSLPRSVSINKYDQGPRSYFESGGAENAFFSVTLKNFQKKGGGLKPPCPSPSAGAGPDDVQTSVRLIYFELNNPVFHL